jgi:Protein of unknown function (DUF3237)
VGGLFKASLQPDFLLEKILMSLIASAPMPLAITPPALRHVFTFDVSVTPAIEAGTVVGLNSRGRRRIIPITGGVVTSHIAELPNGKVVNAGADFQIVVSETCADLDARYIVALDDGTHIYVANRALRRGSKADVAALVRGERVDPARIYFRCVPQFEVEDARHQWLTESIFVGTGERAPDGVTIRIFEVL